MTLKDLLTPAELHFYKRHIEDGMAIEDLADETELTNRNLHEYWEGIETKLRKAFERQRELEDQKRIGYL